MALSSYVIGILNKMSARVVIMFTVSPCSYAIRRNDYLVFWCPEPESNRHGLFKAEGF